MGEKVKGRCPACAGESLFLGEGGYVTCARLKCPNPTSAAELLNLTPRSDKWRQQRVQEIKDGNQLIGDIFLELAAAQAREFAKLIGGGR